MATQQPPQTPEEQAALQLQLQQDREDQEKKDKNELVINYLTLRRILGILGLLLPAILIVGSYFNGKMESAISHYFYTYLRDVFVVILCAISLFLFAYRGYNRWENFLTYAAGGFGIVTAFAPTTFYDKIIVPSYSIVHADNIKNVVPLSSFPGGPYKIIQTEFPWWVGKLHYGAAAAFFICLAIMCIWQFPKKSPPGEASFFKACGITMLVTIGLMSFVLFSKKIDDYYTQQSLIFWGETICLVVFGISWLRKGKLLFNTK